MSSGDKHGRHNSHSTGAHDSEHGIVEHISGSTTMFFSDVIIDSVADELWKKTNLIYLYRDSVTESVQFRYKFCSFEMGTSSNG